MHPMTPTPLSYALVEPLPNKKLNSSDEHEENQNQLSLCFELIIGSDCAVSNSLFRVIFSCTWLIWFQLDAMGN